MDLASVLVAAARFLTFLGAGIVFGLVPAVLIVLRPAVLPLAGRDRANGRALVARRLAWTVRGGSLVVLISALTTTAVQVESLRDVRPQASLLSAVGDFVSTSFGLWTLGRVLLVVPILIVVPAFLRHRALASDGSPTSADRALWFSWAFLGTGLLASVTLTGHAAGARLQEGVDLVHLAAGSAWITGVLVLALAVPPALAGHSRSDQDVFVYALVARFSLLAPALIAVAALTGTARALDLVPSLQSLRTTDYGQALVVKLLFFAAVILFAGANRFVMAPRLGRVVSGRRAASPRFALTLGIATEFTVGLAILAAAAWVTATPPPA